MRALVVLLALVARLGIARADGGATSDHDGLMFAGGLGVASDAVGTTGIEVGWGPRRDLALLVRAEATVFDVRDGAAEFGIAARYWLPGDLDRIFVEPRVGGLYYAQAYDCVPGRAGECSGGDAHGLAAGLSVGLELARNADTAFGVRAGVARWDWRDAASGDRRSAFMGQAALEISFH